MEGASAGLLCARSLFPLTRTHLLQTCPTRSAWQPPSPTTRWPPSAHGTAKFTWRRPVATSRSPMPAATPLTLMPRELAFRALSLPAQQPCCCLLPPTHPSGRCGPRCSARSTRSLRWSARCLRAAGSTWRALWPPCWALLSRRQCPRLNVRVWSRLECGCSAALQRQPMIRLQRARLIPPPQFRHAGHVGQHVHWAVFEQRGLDPHECHHRQRLPCLVSTLRWLCC